MSYRFPRALRVPALLLAMLAAATGAPDGVAASDLSRSTVFPGADWETRTPAEVGLDPVPLAALAGLVGGSGVIVRDGYLVHTWGSPTQLGDWASASKPALSTLAMIAAGRGLISLGDAVGGWMEGGSEKDRTLTFFQLANMVSGYSRGEGPGEAWAYNDYAINLYGHVVCEKVLGAPPSTVYDVEFAPLGFQDQVIVSDTQYGRIKGMSIRDFARLGLLWLNKGTWDGTALLPETFFLPMTNLVPSGTPPTTEDGPESWDLGSFGGSDDQGAFGPGHYGMNFWVNTNNLWPGYPPGTYAAIGHGGQKTCFVLPHLGIVAVGLGTWGAPGDTTSREVLRLLHEADADAALGTGGSMREESWSRVKAGYRE